jgi:hypothetical protein
MAPCDFWLCPQLKTVLKGKRFEDIDAVKKNATSTLNTFPKMFPAVAGPLEECVSSRGVVSWNSLSPWDKGESQCASQSFVSFGRRESCACALLLFVPCRMSEEQEQCVCINFCVKLGRNGVETFEMLRTAFGEQCLSRARIFERHKRFKEG